MHLRFLALCLISVVFYGRPLNDLLALSWNDDRYTHLPLIPLISIFLLYLRRQSIFPNWIDRRSPQTIITASGAVLVFLALSRSFGSQEALPLVVLGIVLTWISWFVSVYGVGPFRAAFLPLSLLLLFIPLPMPLVELAQVALQRASANVTYILFQLVGTPVLRQGLVFSLPGVDIEVARECSGIRSTTALLITALVLGHLFLRSGWRKASFVFFTIPIAIFKNAVRIATLSWLGVYVSRDYLLGQVHHYSGLPVSALGFCLMIPALLLLQRSERRQSSLSAQAAALSRSSPEPNLPTLD